MRESTVRKAVQLLEAAADHIDEHGLLYNEWGVLIDPDDPENVPCCCVIGTIRYVGGSHPDEQLVSADIEKAIDMLEQATYRERRVLGPDFDPVDMVDWSDHYADRETVTDDFGNVTLVDQDGNRGYVATVLRELAKATKAGRA